MDASKLQLGNIIHVFPDSNPEEVTVRHLSPKRINDLPEEYYGGAPITPNNLPPIPNFFEGRFTEDGQFHLYLEGERLAVFDWLHELQQFIRHIVKS